MTRLPDVVLADVCRRAGFAGPDLHAAIATAIAASGGRPDFDHVVDPGPIARYKGLWGVDVAGWPGHAADALGDPHTAAQTARELVKATDGWDWCPAYRAGSHAEHFDRAAAVVGVTPYMPKTAHEITHPDHLRRVREKLDELAVLHDAIATLPMVRG